MHSSTVSAQDTPANEDHLGLACDAREAGRLSLLTGGSDRPYVFGLTQELAGRGFLIDLISSDELNDLGSNSAPNVAVLNLRGSQDPDARFWEKTTRIAKYYARLMRYAAKTNVKLFHILWNNKFEYFDRTLLMLYYRVLGKKIVLTAHNVNAAKRDGNDTLLNRLTLRMQYHLCHNVFVHTEKMKQELCDEFDMPISRVTVIPFGINNSIPTTNLTSGDAKAKLGIRQDERTILFFGRITPYKGLEYLVSAFDQLPKDGRRYRLIVAGRPDSCEEYWTEIQARMKSCAHCEDILLSAKYIPDNQTEIYFKAADVLVLPYKDIYQSGVLFLAHSFGLPVIAADVGALRDDIVEGETGYLFQPGDAVALESKIRQYFGSSFYEQLAVRRDEIRQFAMERHSWELVGRTTSEVYAEIMGWTEAYN